MKPVKVFWVILFIISSFSVLSQTVYTTKTGAKYHKSSCRYLKYTKKAISLEKAKELGYAACKVCKPSQRISESKQSNSSNSLTDKPETSKTKEKKTTAAQCTGKTKSGTRCKRRTKNANGRCYQH